MNIRDKRRESLIGKLQMSNLKRKKVNRHEDKVACAGN
jgi:hypothetical protein